MLITYGQPVLLDDQIVATFRTNEDGGIEVLALDGLHNVTPLGTVSTESHATGMLRKHVARQEAAQEA